MYKCSNDNITNCDHCGLTEDNLHLFTICSKIQNILTHYQTILTKLIGKTYIPQQHLLILNIKNANKHIRKLTLTIIQLILLEIWQSRNNNKCDQNLLPQHTLIKKINADVQTIVQIHFKKNKLQNTLDQLREQFCMNEAIAKIENNPLKILLIQITNYRQIDRQPGVLPCQCREETPGHRLNLCVQKMKLQNVL